MELLLFAFFALFAVAAAVGVVAARNPVHSALFLLGALFAVAALFVLLWAEFIAVVQLLVYAGGVMVLFLFVIMLVDLGQRGLEADRGQLAPRPSLTQRRAWGAVTVILAGMLVFLFSRAVMPAAPVGPALEQALRGPHQADGGALGNIEWVGQLLYTWYLAPFELASVLLLVAMIGAVVLARRGE